MKKILLVLAACMVATAFAKAVGPAPLGEATFVDTEASTNMPPPVCAGDPHDVAFTLDFTGSPSNAVEIAFGVDADSDGALTPDEAWIVVGWDCAAWFVRNEAEGETLSEPASVAAGSQTLSVSMRIGREGRPSSFAASGGSAPLFTGLSSTPPTWLHDCSWNLCRVTSRGVGSHNTSFVVSSTPDGFKIFVR